MPDRRGTLFARWFLCSNTEDDPDTIIPPDDRELGDLLIAAARGENSEQAIRILFRTRAGT